MTCHQVGGVGVDVGPALGDVRSKPPEALMTDILDPNRNVDAHFHLHALTLKDGSSSGGFVFAISCLSFYQTSIPDNYYESW